MPRLLAEDDPMLRGTAKFIADLPIPERTLHAAFVRSQVAHGQNLTVDTESALAAPGVVAVLTNADLAGADLAGTDLAGADLAAANLAAAAAANLAGPTISFYPETTLDGLMARPLLAQDKVRFVGEPVAVVLAESPAAAIDAAEQVVVEIEPLAAVADAYAARAQGAPILFPQAGPSQAGTDQAGTDQAGSNIVTPLKTDARVVVVPAATAALAGETAPAESGEPSGGAPADPVDPCEGADFVADLVCENPRLASAPIELCGILASYRETAAATGHAATGNPTAAGDHTATTGETRLDIWCTGQGVHSQLPTYAQSLNLSTEEVRVRHPYVGGGFGGRGDALVEFLVVAHCARKIRRPVRWVQTRAEQFFAMPYGRDQQHHIRLGITAQGDIVGLDATMWLSAGAYPHMGPLLASASRRQCTGMYRVPRFRYRYGSAVTNTPPIGAYRGAGQPEVNAALERAIDAAARLAGLDPNLVRRRNLLRPADLPYETRLGITIDSGDPVAALDQALEAIDEKHWRSQAADRLASAGLASTNAANANPVSTRLIGIGVACYSQTAGSGKDSDYAHMQLTADGTFHIGCTSAGHGQGHHTMWARLASATLGVAPEAVSVTDADTAVAPVGLSTGGSRSTFVLGSQVADAAAQLKGQLVLIAERLLEAATDDITLVAAGAHVAGVPASIVSWTEIAAAAEPNELSASSTERLGGPTHPYGTHAAAVEVDTQTGGVTLLVYAAVDDCGVAIDEESVIGQQHGGAAAGISQALLESAIYDSAATPLTTSFADYLISSASSLPFIRTLRLQIPTQRNPLGAKGIGENGAIAAPAAVQNAVVDALAPLGVTHVDIPLSPQRVWQAIRSAAQTA